MDNYTVTVILQPDISFKGATGRRYLTMDLVSSSSEEACEFVKECITPLIKDGVEVTCKISS